MTEGRKTVREGILLRSALKISAASGLCQIGGRPHRAAFRFDRLDFGDQITTGADEISKRWQVEGYLVGGIRYEPDQLAERRPIVMTTMYLVVLVRYLGNEIDGEFFEAQASGEIVL